MRSPGPSSGAAPPPGSTRPAPGWPAPPPPRPRTPRTASSAFGPKLAGAPDDDLRAAARVLRDSQRDDGGWAQLDGGDSDAYATGTALVTLHLADDLATDDSAYRRGLEFLVKTQKDDGSWHVASRSRPIQRYFETGFPHGKDQFISMSATGWATAALALACPKPQ
jgi:hypothetical protein